MFGKKNKELLTCDKCGESFPKSKLKRCHTCGMVLCRNCRKHHTCSIVRVEKTTGQTVVLSGNYQNPQSIIKITDMRIYEIARSPSIMTEEERMIIETDSDIRRRYNHYKEIIEENGY